ncbi:YetF domain-containing protein [Micromonospora sp. NPDC007271]|uniref:YetF domain-containing protein n=1 Tax=Micromonospora sp. NPDC007271 TaxID=3154587 RepID=UPI0033E36D72
MKALIGHPPELVWVGIKAVLLYVTAVVGFRISRRRTVGDVSPYDFVAAVAVGAIVGRLPSAADASYLAGLVTLLAILLLHALLTRVRFTRLGRRLVDHPPRVLVAHGEVLHDQLRGAGLTRTDLDALLRGHGVTDPGAIDFAVLEQQGRLSIVARVPAR